MRCINPSKVRCNHRALVYRALLATEYQSLNGKVLTSDECDEDDD